VTVIFGLAMSLRLVIHRLLILLNIWALQMNSALLLSDIDDIFWFDKQYGSYIIENLYYKVT
jgi:hypothetical protein